MRRKRRVNINRLPAPGTEQVIKAEKATTWDALRIVEQVARLSAQEPEIIELAALFKNIEDKNQLAELLGTFVFRTAYFEPDSSDHQRVKTATRILRDGKTNCVGYSTLISAILTVLQIPHVLRLIDTGTGGFNHIYPVLDGIPIDVVPQQDQSGSEHINRLNGVAARVGVEVPYKRKYDLHINPVR